MDVVVVMAGIGTSLVAQRIFEGSFIIEDFMDDSLIKKSFQCSVQSDAIKGAADLFFDIAMGQRVIPFQKQGKDFQPVWGGAHIEILQ